MIQLKDINKTYNNGAPLHVLKGINLDIKRGEFVSIMGASGSGKSTLLNILGILDNYDTGEYYLNGTLIKNLSETKAAEYRNRMIGFIFQSFNLISFKNAVENVALPLSFRGEARQQRMKKAEAMIKLVGLEKHKKHMPNQMSGGQQQRVGVARALVVDPQIIFADEPTGNLDSHTAEEIMTLMQQVVRKHNKTLVMVTHDDHLASYADRIFHIRDGKILKIEETNQKREDEEYEHEGN